MVENIKDILNNNSFQDYKKLSDFVFNRNEIKSFKFLINLIIKIFNFLIFHLYLSVVFIVYIIIFSLPITVFLLLAHLIYGPDTPIPLVFFLLFLALGFGFYKIVLEKIEDYDLLFGYVPKNKIPVSEKAVVLFFNKIIFLKSEKASKWKKLDNYFTPKIYSIKELIKNYVAYEHTNLITSLKENPDDKSLLKALKLNLFYLNEFENKISNVKDLPLFIANSTKQIEKIEKIDYDTSIEKIDAKKINDTLLLTEMAETQKTKDEIEQKDWLNKNNKFEQIPKIETHDIKNSEIEIKSPIIIDWESLNKLRQDIGKIGEEIILTNEKETLRINGKINLINEVKHVSVDIGDGLGYDIISFDSTGNQIFIEVKSTTNKFIDRIYFTKNEIQVMNEKKEKYQVFCVYDLNIDQKTCKIKSFKGQKEILNSFDFSPVSYKVKSKV